MADLNIQAKVLNSDGSYSNLNPVSNASLIKTSDGSNVQTFIDSKGVTIATLENGKVPKAQLPMLGGYVRQNVEPDDTSLLWVDSGNGNILKYYNGSAWASVPATWG